MLNFHHVGGFPARSHHLCDLLPQNDCEVANLYTEIQPVKHVTEQ